MKDQKKLLNKCILNDIPAIVFQGDDLCMVKVLRAALDIYRENGCSEEFLMDFQALIDDAVRYQNDNLELLHLPKLTEVEKELIREDYV